MGKKQFLVPYLMSSHPGSTLKDAVELALFLKEQGIHPEQVQDFYPTPGTVSTCMFFTGMNPYTMGPVFVPKTSEEKAMQRALLQYFLPKNHALVVKALRQAGRSDLIGTGPKCLVPPLHEPHGKGKNAHNKKAGSGGHSARGSQNGTYGKTASGGSKRPIQKGRKPSSGKRPK